MSSHRPPLEVERLLPENSRRVSVDTHQEFRESLAPAQSDDDFDDLIEVPWPEVNPPSRRKDSEVNRVLSILDGLQTGKANQ